MTEENAKLLAIVQDGAVPAGYTKVWHLMPEEWKDVPLSYIFTKKNQKNKGNSVKTVFTNSAVNGIIPQSEYFEKDIANSENTEGYFVVDPLDYVYNPRISENAPYGPFKRNDTGITGIVSPLYTVLTPRKEFCESEFLHYYLESAQWHKYAYSIANYGARFDRMNITDDELMRLPIAWPSLAEQERIAEILMQCDKVIELKQKRIEEEKKKKIWLYRRILTGKTRLKGYETPWVETTIGEQVEYLVGYPFESASFFNDGIKLLRGSNVKRGNLSWGTDITAYWSEDSSISDYLCQEGDIVIAMDGAQVGRSFSRIGNNDLPCYLVQRVARLRSNINGLIVQWIGGSRFARHIDQRKTSTAIPHMTIKDILSYEISIPTDEKEIEHISQLLNQQDQFIDLLEKEMNELCNRKASLAKLLLTGIVRTKV